MASENENLQDDVTGENFSLESILAEYKGSAYINGDKKTPPEILHKKTEKIIKEAVEPASPDSIFSGDDIGDDTEAYRNIRAALDEITSISHVADAYPGAPKARSGDRRAVSERVRERAPERERTPERARASEREWVPEREWAPERARVPERERAPERARATERERVPEQARATERERAPERARATERERVPEQAPEREWVPERASIAEDAFMDAARIRPADNRAGNERARERTQVAEDEKDSVILFFENFQNQTEQQNESIAQEVERGVQKELGLDDPATQTSETATNSSGMYIYSDSFDGNPGLLEDEVFEEPDLKDATARFAEAFSSISLRCLPAALITIIMVILTFAFEAGKTIPFGIGHEQSLATGMLMIGLLIVMILCVDILVRGVNYLIRGAPNVETLLLFSCTFSILSAAFSMITGSPGILPFCAVSAFSLSCAAVGERFNLRAITETLKTATSSTKPYGVQAEYNHEIDKSVLKKADNRTDGFYNNLMHPDIVETAYRFATPILLAAALVLSIIAALAKRQSEYFLHVLSALFAAIAPFSAILAFSVPFSTVARTIRRSGAAIAGWGGADDICFTDGACVTDDDLFPPGTLTLNGLKLYDGVSPEKAIRYTASLVLTSGSGLSYVFSELLKSQGMRPIKVEDFSCYEGGIGALIRGERVATGSAGFMNLLGFRIPDDMNMKNGVYTAVNDKLIAVFAVDYSPANSVQGALISILKWRIKLFFAVRDFNVTPAMLEQKFRVSLDDFAYVQTKDSYSISDSLSGKEGRMASVLTREGFGPFAEAVTGGRLLKSAALVATIVSIVSAALGVLVMFYMCWSSKFASASPGKLMLFMLSMLAAVLIVCGYVRCRK